MLIEIPLEVIDWHLIAILKLSIVLCILLYGVICQMYIFVRKVIYWKFFRTCSEVAVSIKEALLVTVYGCHKTIASNIKFTAVNQKWFFYIFLNNHCPTSFTQFCFKNLLYLTKWIWYVNARATIGIFPRFYNPHILTIFLRLKFTKRLQEILIVRIRCIHLFYVKCQWNS